MLTFSFLRITTPTYVWTYDLEEERNMDIELFF